MRWRGIEATLQLAQSPNTKIVIIGSGKDGLPVILGNVDTPMQPNPAPAAGPAAAALPDNSEAARQRPTGASPPFVEKTPTSNLPSPAEQPSPTGAARTTPAGSTPSGATPSDATPNKPTGSAPNQQSGAPSSEPRTSWTWSEIQDLIARTVGSGAPTPESRPPATGPAPGQVPGAGPGTGAASAPRPAAGPPPPQAEGPPPPRADRGSPRPPDQPR